MPCYQPSTLSFEIGLRTPNRNCFSQNWCNWLYLQASIFCAIKLKRREETKCYNFQANVCKGAIRVCSHHRQVIGKAITLKWNASRPISDPPLLCCKLFEYKYGRKLISSKNLPSVLSSLLLVSHVILLVLHCTVLLHIFSRVFSSSWFLLFERCLSQSDPISRDWFCFVQGASQQVFIVVQEFFSNRLIFVILAEGRRCGMYVKQFWSNFHSAFECKCAIISSLECVGEDKRKDL